MTVTTHSIRKLRIGIVGGSIAGCAAAAVALQRAGHGVTIFERSPDELTGRGAGIGTQMSVLRALHERDLIDADMPSFHAVGFPHIGRSITGDRLGRTAWVAPITTETGTHLVHSGLCMHGRSSDENVVARSGETPGGYVPIQ